MNKKIKKALRIDSIFIFILIFLMFAIAVGTIVYIIKYTQINPEEFELKIIDEEGLRKGSYGLFIKGDFVDEVNYNEYARKSIEDGKTNEKMCLIINSIHRAIYSILLGIIFIFIYLIMNNIIKEGRPFSKTNIILLRVVAILVMLTSIIPGLLKSLLTLSVFLNSEITLEHVNFLGCMLGILIGILSNIFKHGSEIQEDIDTIA